MVQDADIFFRSDIYFIIHIFAFMFFQCFLVFDLNEKHFFIYFGQVFSNRRKFLIKQNEILVIIIQHKRIKSMDKWKVGIIVALIILMLSVGLHFGVAATGYDYYDHDEVGQRKIWDQTGGFIVIASIILFFACLFLLLNILVKQCVGAKWRHVIATVILLLVFTLAVVIAIRASLNSIEENRYRVNVFNNLGVVTGSRAAAQDQFDSFCDATLADTWLLWLIFFPLAVFVWFWTLHEFEDESKPRYGSQVRAPPVTDGRL